MRQRKYRGVFLGLDSGEETTEEFEDWIDDDGDLVCTIGQLVEDWAYQFYDKGSYKTISFEEITEPMATVEDWEKLWSKL